MDIGSEEIVVALAVGIEFVDIGLSAGIGLLVEGLEKIAVALAAGFEFVDIGLFAGIALVVEGWENFVVELGSSLLKLLRSCPSFASKSKRIL